MERLALMRSRVALMLLAAPFAVAAAERAAPWSEAFRLAPDGSDVAGVPIAAIDADWRAARVLSQSDLDDAQRAELKRRGLSFLVQGDFNDDGHPDKAVVGTYADRHGKTGRFVAILTQYTSRWTRVYREVIEGAPGFGALSIDRSDALGVGRIRWTPCAGCAPAGEIAWSGQNYLLIPSEPVPAR